MNGATAATAEKEVTAEAMEEEEEEFVQRLSSKGKIASSLGLVVSLGVFFFAPQVALEPGLTAIGLVVAGAAAVCWDVYGPPLLRAASLHSE